MILLFLGFADFGPSSFSQAMLNVKVQPSIFPMQAPEKTPDLLTEDSPAKWCSRGHLLSMSEYFLDWSGLKFRTFSTDGQRTLLYKNQGKWSNKTKQAIQLGYANRIIYSNILLFDLKKRMRYI